MDGRCMVFLGAEIPSAADQEDLEVWRGDDNSKDNPLKTTSIDDANDIEQMYTDISESADYKFPVPVLHSPLDKKPVCVMVLPFYYTVIIE